MIRMNRFPTRAVHLRDARRPWRAFDPRDARSLDRQIRSGAQPCCPCCGEVLEAQPGTRMAHYLPLDATGYDLDCRGCRRFRCIVRHTARSLRLVRMRRLVAAVRAMAPAEPEEAVAAGG